MDFSTLTSFVVVLFSSYVLTLSMLDTSMIFHNFYMSYFFTLSMMGWFICPLNVAVAWIEVVEKSQRKGQKGNTAMYKWGIYGGIAA